MMVRRVRLSAFRLASKIIATVNGVRGEEFPTEVYWPWPLSANPRPGQAGRSPLIEGHDKPDNRIAFPPSSAHLADEGGFAIALSDSVSLRIRDDGLFVLQSSEAIVIDAPDLIINGKSFKDHAHIGVDTGGGTSGPVA